MNLQPLHSLSAQPQHSDLGFFPRKTKRTLTHPCFNVLATHSATTSLLHEQSQAAPVHDLNVCAQVAELLPHQVASRDTKGIGHAVVCTQNDAASCRPKLQEKSVQRN